MVVPAPSRLCLISRVAAERRQPSDAAESDPFQVGADGQCDPLILATTAIGPVRGPYRVSVPDARGPLAVQLLGYEELAEHESCCFKLREIEKLSLASARPIYERRQDGRRASQPADSIRVGNGRIERLLAGVAQERRQPDH